MGRGTGVVASRVIVPTKRHEDLNLGRSRAASKAYGFPRSDSELLDLQDFKEKQEP